MSIDVERDFGPYGGRFVPEALVAAIDELTEAFHATQADPAFREELARLHRDYTGRPSPLTTAARFSEHCGGATVLPGDVIVGDGDGVIAIPRALAAEVAAEAVVQEAEDAWIAEQVRGGAAVDGLFPLNAEWRARYESEQGR